MYLFISLTTCIYIFQLPVIIYLLTYLFNYSDIATKQKTPAYDVEGVQLTTLKTRTSSLRDLGTMSRNHVSVSLAVCSRIKCRINNVASHSFRVMSCLALLQ